MKGRRPSLPARCYSLFTARTTARASPIPFPSFFFEQRASSRTAFRQPLLHASYLTIGFPIMQMQEIRSAAFPLLSPVLICLPWILREAMGIQSHTPNRGQAANPTSSKPATFGETLDWNYSESSPTNPIAKEGACTLQTRAISR